TEVPEVAPAVGIPAAQAPVSGSASGALTMGSGYQPVVQAARVTPSVAPQVLANTGSEGVAAALVLSAGAVVVGGGLLAVGRRRKGRHALS
ncbi:LPXTG cell wall anchor domain-containing protein, partial [Paenarthrobacter sp. NPDC056912]|uniref:LPXTG cell wall anchor domain-containing protein n=1 Tax=Paenarthrobacter sp. NPDC056912 TaxID=3345965 RepID=UPI00366F80A5